MSQHKKEVEKQKDIEANLETGPKVSKSDSEKKAKEEKIKKIHKDKKEKLDKLEEEREKIEADAADEEGKIAETERQKKMKPKEYKIDTLKTPLTEDEEKAFNELDEDEQKQFIIKRWIAENSGLDTGDQHEVSLDDMRLIGAMPPVE